jgi:hypothetical protein
MMGRAPAQPRTTWSIRLDSYLYDEYGLELTEEIFASALED